MSLIVPPKAAQHPVGRAMQALVGCTLLAAGCAHPYLSWTPREPLAARHGKLAITVEDRRAGDRHEVGRGIGFGGVPRAITIDAEEPRLRLDRLAREAARTAGLDLSTTAEPPSARLLVALEVLDCDGGSFTAKAELRATISIAAADGAQRIAPETFALRGKGHACDRAFAAALDELLDELAARLVEGPWHDAAVGG